MSENKRTDSNNLRKYMKVCISSIMKSNYGRVVIYFHSYLIKI